MYSNLHFASTRFHVCFERLRVRAAFFAAADLSVDERRRAASRA
jgi:hypothetical protein